MIKGITEKEERIIKEILKNFPYDFYYYGSRVKGDYTKGSDLDILIKSDTELSFEELELLETKFNESKIPYRVNFCQFKLLDEKFYRLIEKSLVEVKI